MITNEVMDNIFNNHGHRISQWNDDVLSPHLLQEYADVIHTKGAPLENCFGFIDGTVRPIARPDQHQRIVWSQACLLVKIPVCCTPKWAYWKYVWLCLYVSHAQYLVEIGSLLPSFLSLFFF